MSLSEQVLRTIFDFSEGYNFVNRQVCSEFREMVPEVNPLVYLDVLVRDGRPPEEVQPLDGLMQKALDMRLFHLLEFNKEYIPKDICYMSAGNADLEMLHWCKERGFGHEEEKLYLSALRSGQVKVLDWIKANYFLPQTNLTECATESGFLEGLVWYINEGHEIDPYCLHFSVTEGYLQITEFLLPLGVGIDEQLFSYAAGNADIDMLELL